MMDYEAKAKDVLRAVDNEHNLRASREIIAAALRAAAEEAAMAQMERDCRAVCLDCRKARDLDGDTHTWNSAGWGSKHIYENRMRCRAINIRNEWAAAHPPASVAEARAAGGERER